MRVVGAILGRKAEHRLLLQLLLAPVLLMVVSLYPLTSLAHPLVLGAHTAATVGQAVQQVLLVEVVMRRRRHTPTRTPPSPLSQPPV